MNKPHGRGRVDARRLLRGRRRGWPVRDERGAAAAVEAVLLIPAVVLLLGLVIAGARVAIARDTVEDAAGAAARAATIARTAGDAQQAASQVADSNLATSALECTNKWVRVDTSGFAVPVGQPASVTATVSCTVGFGDLAGLAGTRTFTAASTQPLDTFRTR